MDRGIVATVPIDRCAKDVAQLRLISRANVDVCNDREFFVWNTQAFPFRLM